MPGGCGVAYELTPPTASGGAWTETILHTFGEVSGDGFEPMAPLTMGPGGTLYGTTYYGGADVCPNPRRPLGRVRHGFPVDAAGVARWDMGIFRHLQFHGSGR